MAHQKVFKQGSDDIESEGKYTEPRSCIFFTLEYNYSVNRCRHRALYSYLTSLYSLVGCTFAMSIPAIVKPKPKKNISFKCNHNLLKFEMAKTVYSLM